jgi:hypothetical protein
MFIKKLRVKGLSKAAMASEVRKQYGWSHDRAERAVIQSNEEKDTSLDIDTAKPSKNWL